MGRKEADPITDRGMTVRQKRHELGLSMTEAARRAKISQSHLSRIARGVVNIPAESVVENLSALLGVPAGELFPSTTRSPQRFTITLSELQEVVRVVVRQELERLLSNQISETTIQAEVNSLERIKLQNLEGFSHKIAYKPFPENRISYTLGKVS